MDARQRAAKRQAIVAEAVRVLLEHPAGVHERTLANHISQREGVQPKTVIAVLDDAGQFRHAGSRFRLASGRHSTASANAVERDWPQVRTDVIVAASAPETDVVAVKLRVGSEIVEFRLDHVRDGTEQVWTTTVARGRTMVALFSDTGAATLSDGKRLPLIRMNADDSPPKLSVWRESSPSAAGAQVETILRERLGVAPGRVKVDRVDCDPLEAAARVEFITTVRRLVGRQSRGRKDFIVHTCDRCGLPLSDPTSVRVGVGPECLKYYSRTVLQAVRNGGASPPRRGSRTPRTWLTAVLEWASD